VFRLQEFKFNWYPQEPQLQKNKVKPLEFSIYISAAGFVPALILKLKDYNIKKKKKKKKKQKQPSYRDMFEEQTKSLFKLEWVTNADLETFCWMMSS
jgi:hypothetical protein